MYEPPWVLRGVKHPQTAPLLCFNAPIIAHPTAPIFVHQPPFRCNAFGPCCPRRGQGLTAPAKSFGGRIACRGDPLWGKDANGAGRGADPCAAWLAPCGGGDFKTALGDMAICR